MSESRQGRHSPDRAETRAGRAFWAGSQARDLPFSSNPGNAIGYLLCASSCILRGPVVGSLSR